MVGSRVPSLMFAALALGNTALATDVVVGNGQPGSCTEFALNSAVAVVNSTGGSITFNCGGAATIGITSEKVFHYSPNPNLVYTIDGGGNVTLDGGGTTRLIHHRTGTLNVRNIAFTGGRAQGSQDNASGGALRSDPNPIAGNTPLHLNLTNVTFTGNFTNLTVAPSPPFSPYDYGGGALFTRFGIVTMINCHFGGNTAHNTAGGAMHVRSSTVTIMGSLFQGNASNGGGFGGAIHIDGLSPTPAASNGSLQILATRFAGNTTRNQGGAIFFYLYPAKNESVSLDTVEITGNQIVDSSGGPSGTQAFGGGISGNYGNVTVLNSTIANNVARSNAGGGSGGGIVLSGNGLVVIRNTTISNNRGEGTTGEASGGGLAIFNNTQPFEITHSTIAFNLAGWVGGGIFTNANGTLRNTIVAHNQANAFPSFGQQCSATLTSGGGVLEFPSNNPPCVNGVMVGNPGLGALASNGGFSQTHSPQAGSAAIDAGACTLSSDQRGVGRPQGPACDLGAVEVVVAGPPSPATDFFTVAPCRIVDTRQPTGPTGGAPLVCGLSQVFTITGGVCGIPANAEAVASNVAVTQPSTQGNLNVFPGGSLPPLTSIVNYAAGQTRGNNALLPLSSSGQVGARCGPSGTAHVIIDVSGYFQ